MSNKKTLQGLGSGIVIFFLLASVASAANVVSLPALQKAATNDPYGPQGSTTSEAVDSVKIVEAALAEAGYLDKTYAYDGSYGTTTVQAYKNWQKDLGSSPQYCDGIPGIKDLTKLGSLTTLNNKYKFTVSASMPDITNVDTSTIKEPTKDNKAKEVGSLKLSDKGTKFLQSLENCPEENGLVVMYNDQAGHCTIGYGHLIHYGRIDGRASEKPYENGITYDQALDLFSKDIKIYEAAVNSNVKVPLTQNQFDALVIFTFNIGIGDSEHGLLGSSALKELNKGNYNAVPSKMKLFNKVTDPKTGKLIVSKGLVNRRNAEANLFIEK